MLFLALFMAAFLYLNEQRTSAHHSQLAELEQAIDLKNRLWQTQEALSGFWLKLEELAYAESANAMQESVKDALRLFKDDLASARRKLKQINNSQGIGAVTYQQLEQRFAGIGAELESLKSQLEQDSPNPIELSLTIGNLTTLRGDIQKDMQFIWQSKLIDLSKPSAIGKLPLFLPLLVTILGLLLLFISYRPIRSLQSLSSETLNRNSLSDLENRLRDLISASQERLAQMERELSANMQNTTKIGQTNRRIEHELALLKLYNENLVNSLRTAIIVTDLDTIVQNYNSAAHHILVLGAEDTGTTLRESPFFAALAARQNDILKLLSDTQHKESGLSFTGLPFVSAEKERLLDLSIVPYRDESGNARGFIWVIDDVTDTATLRNQLMRSERLAAVGQLSAQVAHEIRNPLSAIGLNAELLEEEFGPLVSPQNDKQAEALTLLKGIGAEVERLNQVTETYLQLARLPQPEVQEADINVLLNDLLSLVSAEMKQHHIDIELNLDSPVPVAVFDPGQLRQAILNMIINSKEAMLDGGRIVITTNGSPQDLLISVSDTGPGIPTQMRNRIFEPFFSTKPDGTGLGLSLTQEIIQGHGGEIEVEENMPSGTTIRVRLPAMPQTRAIAV